MGAQLKSGNALVRLLLKHGEKIGIVAFLACAGMLIYSSLGRERLAENRRPQLLETSAEQAQQKVEQMNWETLKDAGEVLLAEEAPEQSGDAAMKPVLPEGYPNFKESLDPRILPEMKLREDPVLLPLVDLEVNSGSGLWASDDPDAIKKQFLDMVAKARKEQMEEEKRQQQLEEEAREGRGRGRGERDFGDREMGRGGYGGVTNKTDSGAIIVQPPGRSSQGMGTETIKSRSWVTVLAKVPIKAQVNLYNDALEEARGYNPQTDVPEYRGYIVERAEITEKGQGEWERVATIYDKIILDDIQTWPFQAPEVINEKYSHPHLTYPLPPMVLRQWGEDATHSDLPLPSPDDLYGDDLYGDELEEGEVQDDEPANPDDPFARRRPDPRQRSARGYGGEEMMRRGPAVRGSRGRGGRPMMGRGEFGGMEGGMGMMRGMGGSDPYSEEGMGMMRGGRAGFGRGATGEVELPPYQWDFETQNLLFRYFDTSVVPGRSYRYRVQLAIVDANANIPEKYLDPAVVARRQEASRTTLRTDWSKPSPIVSVPLPGLIFIAGAEQPKANNPNDDPEAELLIKTLDSDYAAEIAILEKFARGSVVNVRDYANVIFARRFELEEGEKEPEFDFHTGITLLDFDGGGAIRSKNKDLTAPARALLMDSAGRLMRQSELDDTDAVAEFRDIIEAGKDVEGRRGGRDEGFGEFRGEF